MTTGDTGADTGVGFGVALGLVAVGGAFVMFTSPGTAAAGWGFALAMLAGTLAVMAVQLYG